MIASTLMPAVAAENGSSDHATENNGGHQLLADPPNCPDWPGVAAWAVAAEAELAADIAKESVARDEVFGEVVAGEGIVSTIAPSPFYVPLVVAWQVTREALLAIEVSKEFFFHCESEAHWELLQEVDDKIDELTEITVTDDTENNRIEIENALYPCTPLVGFYLPVANGGQIEIVADVVDQAITGSEAAGFNVVAARNGYNDAVALIDLGAYRDAFLVFCSAYGQLVASSSAANTMEIPRTRGTGYVFLCVNRSTGIISESRNYAVRPPSFDPSTLCNRGDRPIEVLGWYF